MSRTNNLQDWLKDEGAAIENFSEISPKTENTETTEFSKVGDAVGKVGGKLIGGTGKALDKIGTSALKGMDKLSKASPKAKKITGAVALGAGTAAAVGAGIAAKKLADKKRAEAEQAGYNRAIEEQKAAKQNQNKPKMIAASEDEVCEKFGKSPCECEKKDNCNMSDADIDSVINASVSSFSDSMNKEFGEEVTEDIEKTSEDGTPTEEEISETINNSFSEICEMFSEIGLFGDDCNFSDYDMDATCNAAFDETSEKKIDEVIEKASKEYEEEKKDGNFSDYIANEVAFSVAMDYFGFSEEDVIKAMFSEEEFSEMNFGIKDAFKKLKDNMAKKKKNAYGAGLREDKKGNLIVTEKNKAKEKQSLKAAKAYAKDVAKARAATIRKYGADTGWTRTKARADAHKDALIKSLGSGNKKKGQAKLDEYKRMVTDAAMTGVANKLSGQSNKEDEAANQ